MNDVVPLIRRKSGRRKAGIAALIRHGDVAVCCVVVNVSDIGAALQIGPQTYIPNRFTLVIPGSKIYSCTLVWRKSERIGVSFV